MMTHTIKEEMRRKLLKVALWRIDYIISILGEEKELKESAQALQAEIKNAINGKKEWDAQKIIEREA